MFCLSSIILSTERAPPLEKVFSIQISDVLCNLVLICHIVSVANFVGSNEFCK